MQEGGAIYNFTGPQAFGVADNGDSFMAIQKHVFEKGEVTMGELQEAMDHNFGYPDETGKLATWFGTGCCAAAGSTPLEGMDERQIYEAVKRILSAKGSIDINELQKDLQQGSAPAAAAASRSDVGRYQEIKRIMENTTWFGNDDDVVDIITREAGQIYAREVQKYKNPAAASSRRAAIPYRRMSSLARTSHPFPMAVWPGRRWQTAYRPAPAATPTGRRRPLCPSLSWNMKRSPTVPCTTRNSIPRL